MSNTLLDVRTEVLLQAANDELTLMAAEDHDDVQLGSTRIASAEWPNHVQCLIEALTARLEQSVKSIKLHGVHGVQQDPPAWPEVLNRICTALGKAQMGGTTCAPYLEFKFYGDKRGNYGWCGRGNLAPDPPPYRDLLQLLESQVDEELVKALREESIGASNAKILKDVKGIGRLCR